jgi:peptide/nickel transport system substrate-binding protein
MAELTRRELLARGLGGGAALALAGTLPQLALAAGSVRQGGTLTVGFNDGGGTESLNPFQQPLYIMVGRTANLYERLFQPLPDLTMGPRLALSATPNRDATRWQVKLRKGVRFHDGKPFTADDVLYSVAYIVDPKTKSEGAAKLEPIDLKATKRVSASEIVFALKRPIGDFKRMMGDKTIMMASQGLKNFNKPNGTGPFELVQWKPGVSTTLKRNPNYWIPGQPHVDELVMLTLSDPGARLNALLSGQIQALVFLDFAQAKAQASNSSIKIINAKAPQTVPFTMRMDLDPFKDVRTRLAFKLAVDRPQMVASVFSGFGDVNNDLFGKGYPSYNSSLPQRVYDPEKAASLLKAAGQQNVQATLFTSSSVPGMLESATAYKQQAKKAGITINLVKLSPDSYFSNDKYLKVPFYQSSWGASFESVSQDSLLPNSPYNETHWNDPAWTKAFRRAQGIADDSKRSAAYRALQVPLYQTDGYIVWGASGLIDAVSSKVNGIVPNPGFNLGYFEFKDAWLSS